MSDAKGRWRRPGRHARLGFWVSLTVAALGLLSIIEDLELWGIWMGRSLGWLRDLSSPLANSVALAGTAIHSVLELFRGVFRPPVDFLLQWLAVPVSGMVKDMVVVAAFMTFGLLQTERRLAASRLRAEEREKERLRRLFREAGIEVDSNEAGIVALAIMCHHRLAEGSGPFRLARSADLVDPKAIWDAALERYGPRLEALAAASLDRPFPAPEASAAIAGRVAARLLVSTLALATAMLILLNLWLTG